MVDELKRPPQEVYDFRCRCQFGYAQWTRVSPSTLSKREIKVMQLVAADEANKEIGAQLLLSKDSMGERITNVMAKLRTKECTHAVTISLKRGIIEL